MNRSAVLSLLRRFESRNVTYIAPDGSWPIVWERARGSHVWDSEGRRYLDLTAAFGVAAAGHANPRVVAAARAQMRHLLHGMGDVHPHALKARLARELSAITFERWTRRREPTPLTGKVLLANSGFEAVEAAMKTARLATGRRGLIAFEGAYHGLGYGALNVTHRPDFREPFRDQLRQFGRFVPFPCRTGDPATDARRLQIVEERVERLLRRKDIGAILVEPVQGRGGIRIPPAGFLDRLRACCDRHHALLIADEIFTGFGRTGRWFACEHDGVLPDLICLGKALTGGFPLSACVGRADVMDAAWPPSRGEALHTSTFLGHPVGCAMALAQIGEIRRLRLERRAASAEALLRAELEGAAAACRRYRARARAMGLMAGIEILDTGNEPATGAVIQVIQRLLRRGFIFLPEGKDGEVISFTPPLVIPATELQRATRALRQALAQL